MAAETVRRSAPTPTTRSRRALDRYAMAHDASHFLLVPDVVVTPDGTDAVRDVLIESVRAGTPLVFRSGGTSLSGQSVSADQLVDTRRHFRRLEILDEGLRVRVQPGLSVRHVNARLARHRRKLGPDPASEIACTIGGVIANNSSGMCCGIRDNTYQTLESLVVILADGTVIDTSGPDADKRLTVAAPAIAEGLKELRDRLLTSPPLVAEVRRQFSMKNTMGYGLNALLDHEGPAAILAHLMVGSEGTLGFIADAVLRTVPAHPFAATGLAVFPTLEAATAALPALVDAGFDAIELLDSRALAVVQTLPHCPEEIDSLDIDRHAALLVEYQRGTAQDLATATQHGEHALASLGLAKPPELTPDPRRRASLWRVRKGLYPAVAGSRPQGTTALLEDFVVPVDHLLDACRELTALLDVHGYEGSVIFGHARDGNLHFMVNERFDSPAHVTRYAAFTDDLVDLVLRHRGSLKAEHGTGRAMASFVRRQYGDQLYQIMRDVKTLFDPTNVLNPGVIITDDPSAHLHDLKLVPAVHDAVDQCVECGYCEQICPSRDLTMTPRQRIVVQREVVRATSRGDETLVAELTRDYEYDGVDTCAVDGLCAVACPVDINTGDLVRTLRAQSRGAIEQAAWAGAARGWSGVTAAAGAALTVADLVPTPLVGGATRLGRAVLGADSVPLYDGGLPRGGAPRRPVIMPTPVAVYFPSCTGEMFGPEPGGIGARAAFEALCERAGVHVATPPGIRGLCCGTPWKSKGLTTGYAEMADRVTVALLEATSNGALPVVCDAASCTEGLVTMATTRAGLNLRIVDSVDFVAAEIAPRLTVTEKVGATVIHHTCSSTVLGSNAAVTLLADMASEQVAVPDAWGCCAFAGDRGMLHPELTASATAPESAEVTQREYDRYVSVNRTCELGMTRAVQRPYRHVLEILEEATRPVRAEARTGYAPATRRRPHG